MNVYIIRDFFQKLQNNIKLLLDCTIGANALQSNITSKDMLAGDKCLVYDLADTQSSHSLASTPSMPS